MRRSATTGADSIRLSVEKGIGIVASRCTPSLRRATTLNGFKMNGTISLNPLQDPPSRSKKSTTRMMNGAVTEDSDFDTLMAEHVAMHLDLGLNLSSDEACNLAAEAIA